jgi:hypothetical protein
MVWLYPVVSPEVLHIKLMVKEVVSGQKTKND